MRRAYSASSESQQSKMLTSLSSILSPQAPQGKRVHAYTPTRSQPASCPAILFLLKPHEARSREWERGNGARGAHHQREKRASSQLRSIRSSGQPASHSRHSRPRVKGGAMMAACGRVATCELQFGAKTKQPIGAYTWLLEGCLGAQRNEHQANLSASKSHQLSGRRSADEPQAAGQQTRR